MKLFTALLSFFLIAGLAFAGGGVYEGNGQAVIIEGDRVAAEKLAYQSAKKKAATKAMEAYVARAKVNRHDYYLKKGELLRSDMPFVTGERVLSLKDVDGLLKIRLEVKVDENGLARSLGEKGLASEKKVAEKAADRPLVMVVIAEEINGQLNTFPYSVEVVQSHLIKNQYQLVDRTAVERAKKHTQAVQAMLNNNLKSARDLALQFDAGLLVTGRAAVQKSGIQAGSMQSFGATVTLNAIITDTGEVVATASADGSYPHVNALQGSRNAVKDASSKAVKKLLTVVAKHDRTGLSTLTVSVQGINFEQLSILKNILKKQFPQVTNIKNKGFSGSIAQLQMTVSGGVTPFAEALARKDFGGFKLKVLQQSSGKLDLALKT